MSKTRRNHSPLIKATGRSTRSRPTSPSGERKKCVRASARSTAEGSENHVLALMASNRKQALTENLG